MAIVASRGSVAGVERCFDHATTQTQSLDTNELIIFSLTIRCNILKKRTDVRGRGSKYCQGVEP